MTSTDLVTALSTRARRLFAQKMLSTDQRRLNPYTRRVWYEQCWADAVAAAGTEYGLPQEDEVLHLVLVRPSRSGLHLEDRPT